MTPHTLPSTELPSRNKSRRRRALGLPGLLLPWVMQSALAALAPAAAGPPAADPAGAAGESVAARPVTTISESLVFEDIPLVITASRHKQKVTDAPSTVQVIGAAEIERHGYRTLAEALQTLPGFYINYDRNYTYVGVRGFARPGDYNSRVQMQINGHPVNDSVYDYAAVGEDQSLDMALIERIEVVYGPGSTLYGSNALLATINVITRQAEEMKGAQLALEGGSFGRAQARLSYGGQVGSWKVTGSGSALDSNGDDLYFPEYDALGLNGGLTRNTDFEKAYRFFGRADRGPWTLQASTMYRDKGVPTGAYSTVFNDDATMTTDVRNFVDLQYRKTLRDDMDLMVRGSYDEYRYWANYRYDAGGGLLVDNTDRTTGRWLSQEAQLDVRASERHHLTFGQGFVRNFESVIENFDNSPTVVYADVHRSHGEYSAFAQHELVAPGGVRLTTGVRYDDYSTFGSKASPRLALVFAPRDTWRLRASAGRAFRAPNVYELFYESFNWIASQDLAPEVVTAYEASLDARVGSRLDFRLTMYRQRIRDLITQFEPAPGFIEFGNIDRAVTQGGEWSVNARFGNGVTGYLSHSYMRAEDGAGTRLTNYPPHSYKTGVTVPFGNERWLLSASAQFYEERRTLAGTESPDVAVVNTTLVAPLFNRKARLSASVFNLLDRQYGLPASSEHPDLILIPQDGRTFALRLLWDF